MIKEVLVVEGKMDVVAIDKAVEADCIITEGFNLKPQARPTRSGALSL